MRSLRQLFQQASPPSEEPPTPVAWLLLDIDGTIGIEGPPPHGEDLLMASAVNGNVTIRPHVPGLLRDAQAAGARLAWYSAWEEDANPVISSALGQPPLPAVPLGRGLDQPAHLKAAGLSAWIADHHPDCRYAIVDDDLPADIIQNLPANVHAITVDPAQGLLVEHFREALDWLHLAPIV